MTRQTMIMLKYLNGLEIGLDGRNGRFNGEQDGVTGHLQSVEDISLLKHSSGITQKSPSIL
jgi:hypothetical protein